MALFQTYSVILPRENCHCLRLPILPHMMGRPPNTLRHHKAPCIASAKHMCQCTEFAGRRGRNRTHQCCSCFGYRFRAIGEEEVGLTAPFRVQGRTVPLTTLPTSPNRNLCRSQAKDDEVGCVNTKHGTVSRRTLCIPPYKESTNTTPSQGPMDPMLYHVVVSFNGVSSLELKG